MKISDINISEMTLSHIIIRPQTTYGNMYQVSPSTYIFLKIMLPTGLESTQN